MNNCKIFVLQNVSSVFDILPIFNESINFSGDPVEIYELKMIKKRSQELCGA